MSALTEEQLSGFQDQLLGLRRDMLRRLGKIGKHLLPEDEPLEADSQEQAQQLENEEVLSALDDSSRKELTQINAALERMESGDYGECVQCGELIPLKRLQALPYATLCIACATEQEKH